MIKITEKNYKPILLQIIEANKNNDLIWFSDYNNRTKCKMMIGFWAGRNSLEKHEKYTNAIKKLKHILKMSKNKTKWEQYLREQNILDN